jgi:hypothetical protein
MTQTRDPLAQPGGDDGTLRDVLLQAAPPMPDGLRDRVLQDWQAVQRQRRARWCPRPFAPGPRNRIRAVAFAACAAISFLGWFTLVGGPDLGPADQLLAPDALAELSGGLL